jgi:abortive infection bacteriophage resistance protein
MSLIPYTKPYLAVPDQVRLLQARGMFISDQTKAEICLHRIGYYRLSGYAYPFRHRELTLDAAGNQIELIGEHFRPGTEFAQVMELYVFDKKLRLLLLDAIERVEVGLRVEIALLLGFRGPFAHLDPGNFNPYFSTPDVLSGQSPHATFLEKLDDAFQRSREEFAEHFRRKYDSKLPIWMSIELWDFGTLSAILSGMQASDLNSLAALYQLPRRGFFPSWAQSINFVRNICAHHGRLWNRALVQQPIPGRSGELALLGHLSTDLHAQRRIYAVTAILQYLLRFIHPGSSWATRFTEHLATFPKSQHISLRQMGLPADWNQLALWCSEDIN